MSKRFSFIVISNKIQWEKNGQMVPTGLWDQIGSLRTLFHDHLSLPVFPLTVQLKGLVSLVPSRLPPPPQIACVTLQSGSEAQCYQLSPLKGDPIPVYRLAPMGTISCRTPDACLHVNPDHRTLVLSLAWQRSSCKPEGALPSEDTGVHTCESSADPACSS